MAVNELRVEISIMDYKEAKDLFRLADKKIKDLQLLAKAQDRILRGEGLTKAMEAILAEAIDEGLIKGQVGGIVDPPTLGRSHYQRIPEGVLKLLKELPKGAKISYMIENDGTGVSKILQGPELKAVNEFLARGKV